MPYSEKLKQLIHLLSVWGWCTQNNHKKNNLTDRPNLSEEVFIGVNGTLHISGLHHGNCKISAGCHPADLYQKKCLWLVKDFMITEFPITTPLTVHMNGTQRQKLSVIIRVINLANEKQHAYACMLFSIRLSTDASIGNMSANYHPESPKTCWNMLQHQCCGLTKLSGENIIIRILVIL